MRAWSISKFVALIALLPLPALAMETAAQQAFLVDYQTGTPLLEKNADQPMHPSSMSKMMTLYVLFERLKEGRVQLTDTFTVSEKAWRMQGSKSFVVLGGEMAVEDLIRGIIVQSGNDACIVVAEGLSGTEEEFAKELNRVAQKLGMTKSNFTNATGWTDEAHLTTARDLATLAKHLIDDFPEYYHYFSETEYTHHNITQHNRNPLLGKIGVDGLKTGHTDAAGYGITLSAKEENGRRLILVINGLETEKARGEEGEKLLRYGFREFANRTIAIKGDNLADVPVWLGDTPTVAATVEKDAVITLPAGNTEVKFLYRGTVPLQAPVAAGSEVGQLVVQPAGQPEMTIKLVAAQDVPKLSGLRKLWANLRLLVGAGVVKDVH